MARIIGTAPSQMRGSVGLYTYRQTKDGTVVSEKIQKKGVSTRTLKQAAVRLQSTNILHFYAAFYGALKGSFENKPKQQTDMNAFMKANFDKMPVYLEKSMTQLNAAVVAPYQISRGSLPTINIIEGGSVPRTDLLLGELVIDENTTIAEFSKAVIRNNYGYRDGDQLSYFSIIQGSHTVGDVKAPVVKVNRYEVYLDLLDTTNTLYSMVARYGFATVADNGVNYLGLSGAPAEGGYAYVHSRGTGADMVVSTQFVKVNNAAALSQFTGADALERAAVSYGGYKEARFLEPGYSSANVAVEEGQDQTTGAVYSGNFDVVGATASPDKSTAQRVNLGAGAVKVTLSGTNMTAYNGSVKLRMYDSSNGTAPVEVALTKGTATATAVEYNGTLTAPNTWLGALILNGSVEKSYNAFGGSTGGSGGGLGD